MVGAFVTILVGLAVRTVVGTLVRVGGAVGWHPNTGASVGVVATTFISFADCVGLVEGKELKLGNVLGSTEGSRASSAGELVPSNDIGLAEGSVTSVGLVLLPTGTSFTGNWIVTLTEGLKVKLGARRTTEGLELKLEVVLGLKERRELKGGAAMLGPTEGSELKLGDELGPVLPDGTSCADAKTGKSDSNKETFIAFEFGIDTIIWVERFGFGFTHEWRMWSHISAFL